MKTLIPIPPQIVHSLSLPNRSSALAGAAMKTLANAEPFIASDAAVIFCLLFHQGKSE
jgi:hypothetical protein